MSDTKIDIDALTRPQADVGEPSAASKAMFSAVAAGVPPGTEPLGKPNTLLEAMDYSLGLRGKQARGHLLLLVAASWATDWQKALSCAHAVEIVHTASLIIDDLPAMDDASLRRGEPTNHRRFGEPTAILAAIALLSDAFQMIADCEKVAAEPRAEAVAALAKSVGPQGMAGGQQLDLRPVGQAESDIELVHAMKTGALFAAAAEIGSIVAGIGGPRRSLMREFGMLLGKAFQELDDLIDKHGDIRHEGKDLDQDRSKPTLVHLLGREDAEAHALAQVGLALEYLEAAGVEGRDLRHYVLSLTQTMRGKLCA